MPGALIRRECALDIQGSGYEIGQYRVCRQSGQRTPEEHYIDVKQSPK